MLPSPARSLRPVYWHTPPSRSQMPRTPNFGRFLGTLSNFANTSTAGTRTGPLTVPMTLSPSRTGSVSHSAHVTGRMWPPVSMSSAVAAPPAIMLKASIGVFTPMACQLRLSTRTVLLVSWSFMIRKRVMCVCGAEVLSAQSPSAECSVQRSSEKTEHCLLGSAADGAPRFNPPPVPQAGTSSRCAGGIRRAHPRGRSARP